MQILLSVLFMLGGILILASVPVGLKIVLLTVIVLLFVSAAIIEVGDAIDQAGRERRVFKSLLEWLGLAAFFFLFFCCVVLVFTGFDFFGFWRIRY